MLDARSHTAWDLTTAPPWDGADPADQLAELAAAVADMVGGIHRAVLAFSGGGARCAVGTAAVSARVHQIRTELEAVAVAVEALHAGAEDAARAGEESARMCGDLAAEVERGSVVLARVVEAVEAMQAQRERIERLANQLEEIGAFSGVIKQVADKTKLLALNATIEAARAGAHGAAFRVVADEIGSLAADTETQTRRIAAVVTATHADLEPLRDAIDAGRMHGDGVAEAYDARATVRRIGELAESLTAPAEHVAAAAEIQLQALGEMAGHMQGTVLAVAEVDDHATQMSSQALELSASAEDVYELVRPFWTDSFVDNATEVARALARDVTGVFEAVIDGGRVSLDAVLDPSYEEITGPRIASLGRLFDVSRVPPAGFDPPKFSTAYDALVDEELMALYDRYLLAHPWLALVVGSDLNVLRARSRPPLHRRLDGRSGQGSPRESRQADPRRQPCSGAGQPRGGSAGASCRTGRSPARSSGWRAATSPSRPAATIAASCRPTRATPARSSPCSASRSTSTASAGAPPSSAGTPTPSRTERPRDATLRLPACRGSLGGVPEWLNGAVSKTVVGRSVDRGFESHPLRCRAHSQAHLARMRPVKRRERRACSCAARSLRSPGGNNVDWGAG
jgi:methyl-accepting chemotaxis protein